MPKFDIIREKVLRVVKRHGLKIEEGRLKRFLENIQDLPIIDIPDELVELLVIENLTIGESYFFRDRKTFERLKEIMTRKPEWNVLSVGCSKGEEVYTMAIISKEIGVKCKVVGIDVNHQRISEARDGCYRFWSLRFLTDEEIDKYFTKKDDKYCIKEEFKNNVFFYQCNINSCEIVHEGKFDIIFVRRVLLYVENTGYILRKLYDLLEDDGYLITGSGEYFPEVYDHFDVVYQDIGCIFRKVTKSSIPKKLPEFKKKYETSKGSYDGTLANIPSPRTHEKKHIPLVISKSFEEEIKILESMLENRIYQQAYERAKDLALRYPTEYLVWKYKALLEIELSMKDEAKKSLKKAFFLNHHDDELLQIRHFIERIEKFKG